MENDIFDVPSGGLIATNAASFLRQERSPRGRWPRSGFHSDLNADCRVGHAFLPM
jgi:hypothetical protein